MTYLTNKEWWSAAAIRALKTMIQTGAALFATQAAAGALDVQTIASTAVLAGVASMGTSLAGLPELAETNNTKQE